MAALVGCAVMTGLGAAVLRAQVEPGSVAVVYGAGGVGLSPSSAASWRARARSSPTPWPSSARRLWPSVRRTPSTRTEDVAALARELTDGRGADYALDTAGAPGVVAQAYAAVRRGGLVVAVGLPPEGVTADLPASDLPREEKVVTGSFYGSCRPHQDMPLVLDLYMDGRLDLDALVTRTFTWTRSTRASPP